MVSPRLWSVVAAVAALVCIIPLAPTGPAEAADHGEAPLIVHDQGSDIADVYLFLDPNDNTKVIIAVDTHGFIVPAENANLGNFDPAIRYRFQIEHTGDARGDSFVDVVFSPQVSRTMPQTATITLPSGATFTAPTTLSSATADTAPPPTITTDAASGVSFFAGLTDDPFFFDIPAELRYRASRVAGAPNPAFLTRGRDSFAGYNVTMIVLSIPRPMLQPDEGGQIGLAAFMQRTKKTLRFSDGTFRNKGAFLTIDRMGIPAVNTVFIPFARKNEYNAASTVDDADGRFANDIVASLTALGTDQTSIGILASVAVTTGDMLRLNTSIANSGSGGGTNAEGAFPNGRRPGDDVIDTIVTLVNNRVFQGDAVDGNDVPLRSTFPFFAPPHQPFSTGTVDDRTRN